MDSKTPSLDFAIVGHSEDWKSIQKFINGIRTAELEPLPVDKIKEVFGFIPPREIFRITLRSKTGKEVTGVYIESFIDPDKLGVTYLRTNINKVKKAVILAAKLNAKRVALGGFTSIVLEGNIDSFEEYDLKVTTGNTLTAAFIVKSVEKAVAESGHDLNSVKLLVIGATGDIGMACIQYFKGKVKKLILNARNKAKLENAKKELIEQGVNIAFGTSLEDLIPEADVIISVASSNNIELKNVREGVIICDAGYPKNLDLKFSDLKENLLFHGGMGKVSHGYWFRPDYSNFFYTYPDQFLAHGCVLEVIVMAFENVFENYSTGKGNITNIGIEEIYSWSLKHGVILAPFYNSRGLCNQDKNSNKK